MCLAIELNEHVRLIAIVEYPRQDMLTSKLWNALGDIEVLGVHTTVGILNGIDTRLTVTTAMTVMRFFAHSIIAVAGSDSLTVTPNEMLLDFLNVCIVTEKDLKSFLLHSL
jgi:hypothetical protein